MPEDAQQLSSTLVNGIVVDAQLLGVWPDDFVSCWIGVWIDTEAKTTLAALIESNDYQEGSVVYFNTQEDLENVLDDMIASIAWDNVMYRFFAAYVTPLRREQGIGFLLARWARTHVADTFGVELKMPFQRNRTPETQHWIETWAVVYNDPNALL